MKKAQVTIFILISIVLLAAFLLLFNLSQNIAETKQPVTISEPGTVMHSVGFKANFHQGVIRFLSRSEAEYYDVK